MTNEVTTIKVDEIEYNLTTLEMTALDDMTKDNFYEDGLDSMLWADVFVDGSKIDSKVLRGVLSSLIKKGIIYPILKGRDGMISFTDDGREVMYRLGYR